MVKLRAICCGLAIALGVAGCGWLTPRTGGTSRGRDPLLMSHLTHGKADPLFAGTENGTSFDDSALQSASVSRKYPESKISQTGYASQPDRRAKDYSWIRGRLEKRSDERGVWYLRYAPGSSNDQYGGALKLENDPRLGLLRTGDRVHVEGKVVSDRPGKFRYQIATLRSLGE